MSAIFVPELFPYFAAIAFLYGLMLGSFFNVCIYRIPLGLSVNNPRRSFCFACGAPIRWTDNLPLLSYWLLKGRCRDCGAPFSMRYFLIELLTGLLFLAVFLVFGYAYATFVFTVFISILIISTFTDLDHWIIPDSMSLGGAAAGIGLVAIAPVLGGVSEKLISAVNGPAPPTTWWGPGVNALFGAGFGYGLLWGVGWLGRLLFRKEAMGMGDLKLFACIGAFLGWNGCLFVLMGASAIGTVIGVPMLIWNRFPVRKAPESSCDWPVTNPATPTSPDPYDMEDVLARSAATRSHHHLPFGPYIALAALLVTLGHDPIFRWWPQDLTWNDFRLLIQMLTGGVE